MQDLSNLSPGGKLKHISNRISSTDGTTENMGLPEPSESATKQSDVSSKPYDYTLAFMAVQSNTPRYNLIKNRTNPSK